MTTAKRRAWELEGLMESLKVNGRIELPYRKVLALLGRENWTKGAWEEICENFEAVGGEPSELQYCFFQADMLFLTTADLLTEV